MTTLGRAESREGKRAGGERRTRLRSVGGLRRMPPPESPKRASLALPLQLKDNGKEKAITNKRAAGRRPSNEIFTLQFQFEYFE